MRPNVGGRLAEPAAVGCDRFQVLVLEEGFIVGSAGSRIVMKGSSEHLGAESIPVRPGVDQVKVPRLINGE